MEHSQTGKDPAASRLGKLAFRLQQRLSQQPLQLAVPGKERVMALVQCVQLMLKLIPHGLRGGAS